MKIHQDVYSENVHGINSGRLDIPRITLCDEVYCQTKLSRCADDLEKIVLVTDWSAWCDIYSSRINKRYEYVGIICCAYVVDDFDSGDKIQCKLWQKYYYAPILCRGYNDRCTIPAEYEECFNIHSHPIGFTKEKLYDGDNSVPSVDDFNDSMNRCDVLVTSAGVVIYGRTGGAKWTKKDAPNIRPGRELWDQVILRQYPWSALKLDVSINNFHIPFSNVINYGNYIDKYIIAPKIAEPNEPRENDMIRNIDDMHSDQVIFDFSADYNCLCSHTILTYVTDEDDI